MKKPPKVPMCSKKESAVFWHKEKCLHPELNEGRWEAMGGAHGHQFSIPFGEPIPKDFKIHTWMPMKLSLDEWNAKYGKPESTMTRLMRILGWK